MSGERDWEMQATLLEALPRETEGPPQFRELVRGTLRRCFEQAAIMTQEGRRKLHIETADGRRIDTGEITAHFGDSPSPPMEMKPTDLI
jgi:hypothetical protein